MFQSYIKSYRYLHIPGFCSVANILMQARKKSVMWERRLSTIYHCCADMPWEESCAENPNIGTSILAAVISDLVWGTFQTQGAHNEGLASHEEPAVKLKGHVNCSDMPTGFCCFRDAYSNPKKQGGAPFSALPTDAPFSYLGFIRSFLSVECGHLLILKLQLRIQSMNDFTNGTIA